MLAITVVVASIVVSCKSKIGEASGIDMSSTPLQTADNVFMVRTERGRLNMRMETPRMEHYESDTASVDLFPKGIEVYAYEESGLLETILVADAAKHTTLKNKKKDEKWSAFGNVVIHNVIKQETMETDTLYWDQNAKEIYTDCYIKMYSPDGFMQGYGMRSDDHARNAILHRPFNSYGKAAQDTTAVIIDSVNFIGPFRKK